MAAMTTPAYPQFLVRPHRGGLKESMDQATRIPASADGIRTHTHADANCDVKVIPYYMRHDRRIGWAQTYSITLNGILWGFSDGPLIEDEP